ncbi:hypothetical protein HPB48_019813 [Haemaphysalis longicornis]|uniref:Uncharacterized protein n=1 Tax=Haemaphysalis longicornis TaxID=44386 RepID=A0A9J6G3M8_HAELO|nr:hypothetical protein HPB48_019813 [Haemaphysalis longicornis]
MRFSDKHVIAGNAALLQCPIPQHLMDHVFVTSWQRVDGYIINRNTPGGKLGSTASLFFRALGEPI